MATVYDINIKKLDEKAVIPTYGSEYAAGADLYACLDEAITIEPGQTVMVHTGIAMEIPEGFAGLVYARSGLASKKGLLEILSDKSKHISLYISEHKSSFFKCIVLVLACRPSDYHYGRIRLTSSLLHELICNRHLRL